MLKETLLGPRHAMKPENLTTGEHFRFAGYMFVTCSVSHPHYILCPTHSVRWCFPWSFGSSESRRDLREYNVVYNLVLDRLLPCLQFVLCDAPGESPHYLLSHHPQKLASDQCSSTPNKHDAICRRRNCLKRWICASTNYCKIRTLYQNS